MVRKIIEEVFVFKKARYARTIRTKPAKLPSLESSLLEASSSLSFKLHIVIPFLFLLFKTALSQLSLPVAGHLNLRMMNPVSCRSFEMLFEISGSRH